MVNLGRNLGALAFVVVSYVAVVAAVKLARRATGDARVGTTWMVISSALLSSLFVPAIYYAKNGQGRQRTWKKFRGTLCTSKCFEKAEYE